MAESRSGYNPETKKRWQPSLRGQRRDLTVADHSLSDGLYGVSVKENSGIVYGCTFSVGGL